MALKFKVQSLNIWKMIVLQEKGNDESSFSKSEGYEQLVNVLMDLFIAGTDTTSLTLTYGVLFLTK